MATIGSEKQDRKLTEIAQLAKSLYPDINELTVMIEYKTGTECIDWTV